MFGLFNENGPFFVGTERFPELFANNYTWVQQFSIVYIDTPARSVAGWQRSGIAGRDVLLGRHDGARSHQRVHAVASRRQPVGQGKRVRLPPAPPSMELTPNGPALGRHPSSRRCLEHSEKTWPVGRG